MAMTARDLDALKRQYEGWATDDLLRVVHAPDDYRPEAIAIAREILAIRNVTPEGPAAEPVVAQLQADKVLQQQLADQPLSIAVRLVCVVFCGIPGIAIAAYNESQGYTRRAKEAWKWVFIGWLTWLSLGIVCFLSRGA
jgi:hypothetical protein